MGKRVIEAFRITDYTMAIQPMRERWSDFAEDGAELRIPDIVNEYWIGILDSGKYVGFVRLAQMNSVVMDCHICIMHKTGNPVNYALKAMEWIIDHTPNVQKLVCHVPEFKKGAIKLAKRAGFSMQGFSSDSYLKGGKLHGLVQLGINRKAMEDICHQQSQH